MRIGDRNPQLRKAPKSSKVRRTTPEDVLRHTLLVWLLLACVPSLTAVPLVTAATVAEELRELSLDATESYKVRELSLVRGDIKIYLTEGTLSFAKPVAGQTIAAIFETTNVEGGDGEVLLMPPRRSERASLASYAQSPNLNEHFGSALFFFTDETMHQLKAQLEGERLRKTNEAEAEQLGKTWNSLLRNVTSQVNVRLIESLLDNHKPSEGIFFTLIGGRKLGPFELTYNPTEFEPVSAGQLVKPGSGLSHFQLWTSFRPRRAKANVFEPPPCNDYRVDLTIRPDLTVSAETRLRFTPARDNRVIALDLSQALQVTAATVDGKPAELYQRQAVADSQEQASSFLIVNDEPLIAGNTYEVSVHYSGSMIRKTRDGSYFVGERNTWLPHRGPTLSQFDMTFRCPEKLQIVSTGELVSDTVTNGIRVVHRKTRVAERFAGFNLGEYAPPLREHGNYEVECYANRTFAAAVEYGTKHGTVLLLPSGSPGEPVHKILNETESLLTDYTRNWGRLPDRTLIISPVPGYFGQGFPGLIYLSNVTYLREADRPSDVRDPIANVFFSQMLLPHETAHQWWGNLITSANYRTDWLMEAMANEAAVEELARNQGHGPLEQVLGSYRKDLLRQQDGATVESRGPVDFGTRLEEGADLNTWQTIVYKKGTWVLWMLRERLGEANFTELQRSLITDFSKTPITNDDFRRAASRFVPQDQKDRTLETFFDAWIYNTGIPKLTLKRTGHTITLTMTAVDEDFVIDLPLRCSGKAGREQTHWLRLSAGANEWPVPKDVLSCKLPGASEFLYSE